ncbi:MAG: DUF2971 domain-containing protein [Selenomonas sp.]|nr:DUF2971 domain-containing protein [Selenomonas sp.]
MNIFRYRKFENGIREIEDQTIYFAARNELNDPTIEGYLNVYWQGDCIAWNGLLKNYVCSLHQALTQYLLKVDEAGIRDNAAMVDVHHFDNVPLGNILMKLGSKFLQHDVVKKYSDLLGNNKVRVSRDELIFCLLSVHNIALIDTLDAFYESGYKDEAIKDLSLKLKEKISFDMPREGYERFLQESKEVRQKLLHHIVGMYDDFYKQIYGGTDDLQKRTWLTVITNFPNAYVDKLEDFIHPEVYIACFSEKENDNSMWGKYADNHTGLCLIYDTHTVRGNDTIALLQPYSYSLNGQSFKYRDEKLYQINYGGNVREANFFTMLGKFNGQQLYSWLSDDDGLRSNCLNEIYDNEDKWRNEYWQCLYDRYCHKTKDWEHEKEYRLLLVNTFYEFTSPESRIIKYHFSNLRGVILGMNMPVENQIKVLNAIQKKCEETGRSDFEVYIAEYDHDSDSITKRRIGIKNRFS